MLLKAVGQLLGTAKKENHWETHKGCWKASGQFLKDIGKPVGNAQIKTTPANKRGGRIA
jgi:hypothetical protein